VLPLAPFAPHIAEELWTKLGHGTTLAYAPRPRFDPALAQAENQEYVVQVNGKVRHRFQAQAGPGGDALLVAAKAEPQVLAILESKTVELCELLTTKHKEFGSEECAASAIKTVDATTRQILASKEGCAPAERPSHRRRDDLDRLTPVDLSLRAAEQDLDPAVVTADGAVDDPAGEPAFKTPFSP
jgi:leucyl-tRNA synthetase